ncbi:MAG: bifunctional DNA-formamidopyrimidine glycosylase/DNA-(apurinic or apyrimidinic site) lyase [Alphaproteobacteria bacterium]|nr:bifunctional DNA-formamidopyrimidine glycosylase/DNA-(apurinic or apyrimidinic site) lyase [Alphaproteobacteria bacterium]MBU0803772.1 bifunctional DNA-formamidopyrimidine glycosylase/DNA-(apurinic or apyrimidinic site) lyase [Alphaproteobacteria bacterium]MBU0872931.1 bifunctional DNA-formamidopyrimidine glycosylase/DNA-(apurinic or apyrimidinic site) lyase [Alphaproteobacteria bacterium]MBU1402699.1 bifunctional DNA-formamidopyrimidine glycosylase/DNA-(apurinic or apyrimidinic site) lyase [
MPELPEVETVRRGLQPAMEGARVLSVETRRPDLRFPLPLDLSARLKGRQIVSLGRRAKYLTMEFDRGPMLICHLGMSGSFRIDAGDAPGAFHNARSRVAAHDHVVFHLNDSRQEAVQVIFNDPRRFGFMLFADEAGGHKMLDGLGVEPTGNTLDGDLLAALFRGKKTPLKAALLDQSLIAGLGNIYVAEALWRAGLSPRRGAGSLATASGKATERARRLAGAIRSVIADAIEAGGSTLRDYAQADGSLGYFQHQFSVYDREGEACRKPGCHGTISRIVQSGRSTFYCPVCQH